MMFNPLYSIVNPYDPLEISPRVFLGSLHPMVHVTQATLVGLGLLRLLKPHGLVDNLGI